VHRTVNVGLFQHIFLLPSGAMAALGSSGPPCAQTSTLEGSRSESDLLPVRYLQTMDAFNKTHIEAPQFSIGQRLDQDIMRGRMLTELGPDISDKIDMARTAPPKWSIQSRWKKTRPQGDWVPAPGSYANPSTMQKNHPTIKCSGRGWTWGAQERKSMGKNGADTPSPARYRDDRRDTVLEKSPSWSLIGRWEPEKAYDSCPPLQNTCGMKRRGGVAKTPEWQFLARPASALIPKHMGDLPGPGAHTPQFGGIGSSTAPLGVIKRSPSFGFGTSSRFRKPLDTHQVL